MESQALPGLGLVLFDVPFPVSEICFVLSCCVSR